MSGGATKLRVAVLCSDQPHHRYLVHALRARFDVAAVVVEPGDARVRRLRHAGAWRDWAWALYHGARRRWTGLEAYRNAQFAPPSTETVGPFGTHEVAWINDPAVPALVSALRPDVTVVIGTSILRPSVLSALGPVVLNVHGGWLPEYRGNHCFFFALYAGDFDRVGSTIHFVDGGVDTGDVVARVAPPIHPGDNAESLYCRAERLAIQHLVGLLEGYERTGDLPRHPQPPGGPAFRTRDRKPHHDVLFWLRRRTGRLSLPHRPAPRLHVEDDDGDGDRREGGRAPAPPFVPPAFVA